MKKYRLLFITAVVLSLVWCAHTQEPKQCSICCCLPRHAPCIINLYTGELLELDIYDPHPFLVGEIADEQRGGFFSLVNGASVNGYKVGAESVTITIPIKSNRLQQKHFCNSCRDLLAACASYGYVLVDLKDTSRPVIYPIKGDNEMSFRCYDIAIKEIKAEEKYEITISGTLVNADTSDTN